MLCFFLSFLNEFVVLLVTVDVQQINWPEHPLPHGDGDDASSPHSLSFLVESACILFNPIFALNLRSGWHREDEIQFQAQQRHQ